MSTNQPQRKRGLSKPMWIAVVVFLVAVISVIGWMAWSYFNGKNSDSAAAEEKSQEFIAYLEEQNFSALPTVLNESSLVDAGFTKEQVEELYQSSFDEMQVNDVEVTDVVFNENE